MAADTEQREILAELRELKAEFAAVHKRLDKLDSIDKTTKRTERKADRGFTAIGETLAWQDLIQNLILYGFCLGAVSLVTSIGVIRSEVCPKAPGWALHLIPFGNVICAGATDKPAADTNAVDRSEVMAFLDTIAYAEGTESEAGYQTIFTHAKFSGFDDHPRQVKCSGDLCSDASGRYQFLSTTWDSQAKALGLKDFSPRSQDLAAIQLLKANGAYDLILKGDIEGAIRSAAPIWASFPGAGYDQPEKPMNRLLEVYRDRLSKRRSTAPNSTASDKIFPIAGFTLDNVTSPYGDRTHPTKGGTRFHYGLDFGADEGTPVLATESGTVENTTSSASGCGNEITLKFADGNGARYCHLSSIDVQQGQQVTAGQAIGKVGSTGDSTGPHLHFERIEGGQSVDPTPYLKAIELAPAAQPPASVFQKSSSSEPSVSVPGIQQPEGGMCGSVAVAPDRLVTANHCITSSEVTIVPASGEWLKGRVVKQSSNLDLALIQVEGAKFPVLPMGDSPQTGDSVTAIGYPTANGGKLTITPSTVQAIGQSCGIQEKCFSVPSGVISPGFSGGATIDSQGRLVGVNRAIKETNGVGYMIPIEVVREFAR